MRLKLFKENKLSLFYAKGLSYLAFLSKAWTSELLNAMRSEVSIPLVLPAREENISLAAIIREKNRSKTVIGQCSCNSITACWEHFKRLNLESLDFHTIILNTLDDFFTV